MTKVTTNGGVRIIDPNPDGTNVNQEDLMIYVKLKARTKARSILQKQDEEEIVIEQIVKNVPNETNYTYPTNSDYLTTDWTKIGGGNLGGGTDVGAFGIAGINMDIKSSFIPQVTIDFIDVRGATLFEQGPCSQYAAFFHMPYPVFELTVKGFYGKAVTYTLALRKFNTKFNPSTGNFEVKAEFIGYTYAFLADIVMGYALAAPYMVGATNSTNLSGEGGKLEAIWEKMLDVVYKEGEPLENKMTKDPVTLKKMLKDINELEKIIGELGDTTEFQEVSRLNVLKGQVEELNAIVAEIQEELLKTPNNVVTGDSAYKKGGQSLLKIPVTKNANGQKVLPAESIKIIDDYLGNNTDDKGYYETSLDTLNGSTVRADFDIATIKTVYETINQAGLYSASGTKNTNPVTQNGETYYYIDLGKSFLEPNEVFLTEIDLKIDKQQEKLTSIINAVVKEVLGYVPTIKNVMIIILANVELFLDLLVSASIKAETIHQSETMDGLNSSPSQSGVYGDGKTQYVYPWPLYYEKNTKTSTSGSNTVETFPGENRDLLHWEEVKFVEDFLAAYLELKLDLELISGDVEGKPGFDNYVPLNPIESPLFDGISTTTPIPVSYFRDEQLETIYKNVGTRAFMVGDYTMMNGLTAWKSRYFTPDDSTGSVPTPTPLQTSFTTLPTTPPNSVKENLYAYNGSTNQDIQWITTNFNKMANTKLMRSYGYLDGLNCTNTIVNEQV
ncbi:MAG: hypothetical protein ACW99A_23405, partial [Candidatus Kariarchaeaceae archaeon]